MEFSGSVFHKFKWQTFRLVEWLNRSASAVGQQPFLDVAKFPWVTAVERQTEQIINELTEIQATEIIPSFQDISIDQEEITTDDKWTIFFFYGYGHRDRINCARCPATDRALHAIPGLKSAMFSILAPGKVIPPHRGPYNGVLRYHLGLIIPDDGKTSGIRVADQTREWRVGNSLIFDDSFDHEAWNHSEQQRVVLFVDFERPLRFPVNLLNKLVLFAIRRSRFIQEALKNLRRHHEKHGKPIAE